MQEKVTSGYDSVETLPARFSQSHKAWDAYMAQVWHTLLATLPLGANASVVEIGSGNSIKIGMALASLSFAGSLYLVDPFEEALHETKEHYMRLLPNIELHLIAATLAEAAEILSPRPTCLVSNHSIDDMLLAAARGNSSMRELFGWTSIEHEQTIPLTQEVWSVLAADKKKLAQVKDVVFEEWRLAIETLKPQFCIISQYPSVTLEHTGMGGLNTHAGEVFARLRRYFSLKSFQGTDVQDILSKHPHFNDTHIRSEVLNAKNWFISEY